MIRALVVGAGGRMGAHVIAALEAAPDLAVGGALDSATHADLGKEVSPGIELRADLAKAATGCDVAIDFSVPASTLALIDEARGRGLPLVLATTGFEREEQQRIENAARELAIVQAGNYSLGVTVLLDLVAEAARRLDGYEIDVLEMHHHHKVDAPSGTALALARAAAEARGERLEDKAVYHREGLPGARRPDEIGLQALRLADSVGEHTVYLAGAGERVELTHRALSRENFAAGAVRAARWVHGHAPGLFSMTDVLA